MLIQELKENEFIKFIYFNTHILKVLKLLNYYTFPKFYVMIKHFGCLCVENDVFHISCTIALFSFITLVLESKVHSYFALVSIPKFLQ